MFYLIYLYDINIIGGKDLMNHLKLLQSRLIKDYPKFIDISPAYLIADARNGGINTILCSNEFVDMFGYSKEEMIGKHLRYVFIL
jgi:hypothetical protein